MVCLVRFITCRVVGVFGLEGGTREYLPIIALVDRYPLGTWRESTKFSAISDVDLFGSIYLRIKLSSGLLVIRYSTFLARGRPGQTE